VIKRRDRTKVLGADSEREGSSLITAHEGFLNRENDFAWLHVFATLEELSLGLNFDVLGVKDGQAGDLFEVILFVKG